MIARGMDYRDLQEKNGMENLGYHQRSGVTTGIVDRVAARDASSLSVNYVRAAGILSSNCLHVQELWNGSTQVSATRSLFVFFPPFNGERKL